MFRCLDPLLIDLFLQIKNDCGTYTDNKYVIIVINVGDSLDVETHNRNIRFAHVNHRE